MTARPWPPAGLAKPAHRALAGANITSLGELATRTEADVAALHGMGVKVMMILRHALDEEGLAFKSAKAD